MYSTIALRGAVENLNLQGDEDGVFAVFEDTADRLLLRAVGDGMGFLGGECSGDYLPRWRIALL